MKGGAGDDIIVLATATTEVDGGDGEDTLSFQFSTESVDFALSATANIERVLGSDHRDTLLGSASADRIYGEEGHDLVTGGAGADTLDGGGGADQLVSSDTGNRLIGGDGADRLLIHARENTLVGGAGNDLCDLSELPPALNDESSPPDAPPEPLTTIEFHAGDGHDYIKLASDNDPISEGNPPEQFPLVRIVATDFSSSNLSVVLGNPVWRWDYEYVPEGFLQKHYTCDLYLVFGADTIRVGVVDYMEEYWGGVYSDDSMSAGGPWEVVLSDGLFDIYTYMYDNYDSIIDSARQSFDQGLTAWASEGGWAI